MRTGFRQDSCFKKSFQSREKQQPNCKAMSKYCCETRHSACTQPGRIKATLTKPFYFQGGKKGCKSSFTSVKWLLFKVKVRLSGEDMGKVQLKSTSGLPELTGRRNTPALCSLGGVSGLHTFPWHGQPRPETEKPTLCAG